MVGHLSGGRRVLSDLGWGSIVFGRVLVEHLLDDVSTGVLRLLLLVITFLRFRFEETAFVPHLRLLFRSDSLDRFLLLSALSRWLATALHLKLFEFIDTVLSLVLLRRRGVMACPDRLWRQALRLLLRFGCHWSLLLLVRDRSSFATTGSQERFCDFRLGLILIGWELVCLRIEGVLLWLPGLDWLLLSLRCFRSLLLALLLARKRRRLGFRFGL